MGTSNDNGLFIIPLYTSDTQSLIGLYYQHAYLLDQNNNRYTVFYGKFSVLWLGGVVSLENRQIDLQVGLLTQKLQDTEKTITDLQSDLESLTNRVSSLERDSTETKVYIKQIFSMLEEIKATLHSLNQRDISMQEKNSSQWTNFFRVALGALVGVILSGFVNYLVYYLLRKG